MPKTQREYKDRLFNFIFGRKGNEAWTLSLYNAVNGTHYTDPREIEITTIREILYLGMRNDLAFVIIHMLNLYEQQSSYNPNMPVRLLIYVGHLLEKYMTERRLNRYGSTQLELPVPKLVVFYNGKREQPEEKILRLSDAFPAGSESDIEVRVRMLNVNYGHNQALMAACRPLSEYAWLVNEVRRQSEAEGYERAINAAIDSMPDTFEIKPLLEAHRAEVKGMMIEEYKEADAMELFREEGRAEGRAEGRKEGRKEGMEAGMEVGRKEGREKQAQAVYERLRALNMPEAQARAVAFG